MRSAQEPIISFEDVFFTYDGKHNALDGLSLEVKVGEFLCVLGGNGSGKSTFAKHINALLIPDKGKVEVCGFDTANSESVMDIRRNAGMVFQNPDDQIVASTVENEVAFGPENLQVANPELERRVHNALAHVGLNGFENRLTNELSGGQKQRVAIAGALAMKPQILVLDEPSSMIDPRGRAGLMRTCRNLNEEGLTIVLITHFMEEAAHADRIVVLDNGRIADEGSPEKVLTNVARLHRLSLDAPFAVDMSVKLEQRGVEVGACLHEDELVGKIEAMAGMPAGHLRFHEEIKSANEPQDSSKAAETLMEFENVRYAYATKGEVKAFLKRASDKNKAALESDSQMRSWGGSPDDFWALDDVSFKLKKGEFLGIAGHTGSGKSTLLQIAAALRKPVSGKVLIQGTDAFSKHGTDIVRNNVGVVFQYPENQLFANTVKDDVAFGPKNLGLSPEDVDARVSESLEAVGLDAQKIGNRSPFALSGGQKRRVAIAGILAMHPKILILDEPTAGLDPMSHDSLISLIKHIHKDVGITVVMVSHNMDDLAMLSTRIMLLNKGRVFETGTPMQLFLDHARLKRIGLAAPHTFKLAESLHIEGLSRIPTADQLADVIAAAIKGRSQDVL